MIAMHPNSGRRGELARLRFISVGIMRSVSTECSFHGVNGEMFVTLDDSIEREHFCSGLLVPSFRE